MEAKEQIVLSDFLTNAANDCYEKEFIVETLFSNVEKMVSGIDEKSYELHDSENSNIGYIFIYSYELSVKDVDSLCKLLNVVSYIDISNVDDGSILITLVFYGMNDRTVI